MFKINNIRNFSIVAHIDHGKSTLSNCLIKFCNSQNYLNNINVIDNIYLEQERGITIKAQSVNLNYNFFGINYKLNLIDTPGHIDFSYEVIRALSACEGVLLLVDAIQGIEAQTINNFYMARNMNLFIIIVINKIDLLESKPINLINQIKNILDKNLIITCCSAKKSIGINKLIKNIINFIPPPDNNYSNKLQAIIIDAQFDKYFGVILLIKIKSGFISKKDKVKLVSINNIYVIEKIWLVTPKIEECSILNCGEVGWISCNIKIFKQPIVGNIITSVEVTNNIILPLKKINPQIFVSLFLLNNSHYTTFSNALAKLSLSDASLSYTPEFSSTFGSGFRCGFLGLLHMDIIKTRLEREYNLELVITLPTVKYEVLTSDNKVIYIDKPNQLLNLNKIKELREPITECLIVTPKIYVNKIIKLCIKKRGIQVNILYFNDQAKIIYLIPLTEVILDLSTMIKSVSHGYASLDYNFKYFKKSKLSCVSIYINKKLIPELSIILHNNDIKYKTNLIINKLSKIIPKHQFNVIIQVVVNNKVIARATIKRLYKRVTDKCYGGDISRKKKLINKQRNGKKKLQILGKVNIPKKIFFSLLKIN
ncbi:MAG: translation elongation factor 4 [Candidatus Lightella neohaematopini]|nr:translation elongation factor 4 [Candidatus Lightella neohaematopini]